MRLTAGVGCCNLTSRHRRDALQDLEAAHRFDWLKPTTDDQKYIVATLIMAYVVTEVCIMKSMQDACGIRQAQREG